MTFEYKYTIETKSTEEQIAELVDYLEEDIDEE